MWLVKQSNILVIPDSSSEGKEIFVFGYREGKAELRHTLQIAAERGQRLLGLSPDRDGFRVLYHNSQDVLKILEFGYEPFNPADKEQIRMVLTSPEVADAVARRPHGSSSPYAHRPRPVVVDVNGVAKALLRHCWPLGNLFATLVTLISRLTTADANQCFWFLLELLLLPFFLVWTMLQVLCFAICQLPVTI